MVVHPDVTGNVYLELRQVTVVDVLEILRDLFDLHIEVRGNLVSVMPNTMETRIFTLNYVDLVREGISDMRVSTGSIKDVGSSSSENSNGTRQSGLSNRSGEVVGSRVTTVNSADLWTSLKVAIESLTGRGDGRTVTILKQAGIIVVRALRRELVIVEDFLNQSERSLRRQVILEAKILEVVLKKQYQRGIDWTALSDIGGAKGGPLSFDLRVSSVQNPLALRVSLLLRHHLSTLISSLNYWKPRVWSGSFPAPESPRLIIRRRLSKLAPTSFLSQMLLPRQPQEPARRPHQASP